MGKILVHEFSSLDGVIEDPAWTTEFAFSPAMGESIGALVGSCSAILLGRRTYELFAPAWSARAAEDDPGAPFFNDTPKYVVSGTLRDPAWGPTTVLGRYDAGVVSELKARVDGGIYVSGSATLVRALLADGLVDALHLFVYPVVLGSGLRLFADPGERLPLRLDGCERYDSGVAHLSYAPAP